MWLKEKDSFNKWVIWRLRHHVTIIDTKLDGVGQSPEVDLMQSGHTVHARQMRLL